MYLFKSYCASNRTVYFVCYVPLKKAVKAKEDSEFSRTKSFRSTTRLN